VAKNEAPKTAITPTRAEDYAEWYQQVVRAADLAENSPVRGCMVIKPWGYAIWENIQRALDRMFKDTATRTRISRSSSPRASSRRRPSTSRASRRSARSSRTTASSRARTAASSPIRSEARGAARRSPTSETIIGAAFASWVQSYRDLPLLINQWANVVRWELRTRCSCARRSSSGRRATPRTRRRPRRAPRRCRCSACTRRSPSTSWRCPCCAGPKTASERFPGAVDTYAIEAMMQDRKALQAGTSHFLGQNFARRAASSFQTKQETRSLRGRRRGACRRASSAASS
jgi:prolyl-tRNA synthetase